MSQTTQPAPRLRPFVTRSQDFASGADSPSAVLEECLREIAAREGRVGAFTALASDAREQAAASEARWRAGRPLSAIDGMPVGVKDIIDTASLPTGMGSPLFEGYRPRFDAASVQALIEAGAVIVGKTVTTEFAGMHPAGTRNPWDTGRTPGGSSSGSAAAVGGGMLSGALGTQVVGSILRPAGFCGAYGFKPSVGAINRGGSLDFLSQSVTGSIAASLEDAWTLARAIAGQVGGDPGHPGLDGPPRLPPARKPARLGVLRTPGWSRLTHGAREALEAALEQLRRRDVAIVTHDTSPPLARLEAETAGALDETLAINAWEWRWPLASFAARDAGALSPGSRARLDQARRMTQADYARQLARRESARQAHAALARELDGLVSVTAPGAAPVGLETTGDPVFVAAGSYLGVPGLSLPLLADGGLPLGLQLLGAHGEDAALASLGAWTEAALG